jgi:beta-glucosidase/6-phospho-beta-glucosidase/beta-galactosidase
MIRQVQFGKALVAGATGAIVWDAVARALAALGVPVFDLVHMLGTLFSADASTWVWAAAGLSQHAAIGGIWAVVYAYFFWSSFDWQPAVQGLAFSTLPGVLAGLIMVPQLGWMHPLVLDGVMPFPGLFASHVGWGGPFTIVVGHAIYGLIMGSLYSRPVGYRAGGAGLAAPRISTPKPAPPLRLVAPAPRESNGFMFATGIECSYPTIEHGRWRMDELADTGHFTHWRRDLALVRDLGLRHLRYGPPLPHMWLGPDKYDWTFTDAVVSGMRDLRIVPIMDLCHFGVPSWIGNFQNAEFPQLFADYAGAFARRYNDVVLFTPVNEMYVTARMSALDGVWNEQLRSERGFVTAARHLAKASALAVRSILREQPRALFVNSESGEFFQACCPDEEIVRKAEFENQRRFVPLDLLYGITPSDGMRAHLAANGMPADEYEWFMREGPAIRNRSILGIDYYEWNEKLVTIDGRPESLGELFGWYVITKQYYDRYRRPLMHTETNSQDAQRAPDWLWRQWHNVQLMRKSGIPVVGFTWYSLIDQIDWNIGLARPLGNVNPVGLFDLNRDPRPVAESYRRLVAMFRHERLFTAGEPGGLHHLVLDEPVRTFERRAVAR